MMGRISLVDMAECILVNNYYEPVGGGYREQEGDGKSSRDTWNGLG